LANGEYAKENGSYGLTTLRTRHLEVNGTELRFHFKGKSGRTWRLNVRDRRIARVVRSIQELPGQHLFQYLDDDGVVRSIDSDDVNAYLREIAGPDVSAKISAHGPGPFLPCWRWVQSVPSRTRPKRK
jgi:DNA topoisomerase-1